MVNASLLGSKFAFALAYERYVAGGTPDQVSRWGGNYARMALTSEQDDLVRGFTRRVNVLVISGLWCGDCAQQCPMMARIAQAHTAPVEDEQAAGIDLRFIDRDEHPDLAEAFRICGGTRVPTAIFMAEDFEFVSVLGDKTLARLRAKAAASLGPACPLPGADLPEDEARATLQDWLNEFERVHLLLRLSPRLRQMHED